MHKSQILWYLVLAFLAGVFLASLVSVSLTVVYILLIFGLIFFAVTGYRRTFKKVVGLAIIFLTIGILRFNIVNESQGVLSQFADLKAGEKNVSVGLLGYVDGEPKISGKSVQLSFWVKEVNIPGYTARTNERTLITIPLFAKYNYGDMLYVQGSLARPQNFSDFDYQTYLKKEGIRTVIAFPKIQKTDVLLSFYEKFKISLFKHIFIVKNKFEKAVAKSIPEPHASYINGILLGSRQNIPDDLTLAFNKTSTTHILAISGYNITIIADILLMMLVFFVRRRVAFWVSVFIIILFTIMIGASASVVRAAIMGLLVSFANGYGRLYELKNSVALAGAIMVWLNPLALVFDIGFQLSFLAVIGLIVLYPILEQKTKNWPKLWVLKETLLMTFSAQVMVAPLLIYYFHQFSLVSLPANLLVLPLMPWTMLFGFLTGLGGLIFWPLGKAVGLFSFVLSIYQLSVIKWFASLQFSSLNVIVSWPALAAMYVLIIMFVFKLKIWGNPGS